MYQLTLSDADLWILENALEIMDESIGRCIKEFHYMIDQNKLREKQVRVQELLVNVRDLRFANGVRK